MYDHRYTPTYLDCGRRYEHRPEVQGALHQALQAERQLADGVPNQLVKVGTYQRAKGLEFKQVFLPRPDAEGLKEARAKGEDDASYAERLDLLRRQLFVAMTRARDALWLGWVDTPTAPLPNRPQEPADTTSPQGGSRART